MDTLSPLDAGFLHLEKDKEHLHIGSVAVFDGPEPKFHEIFTLLGARMAEVPRAMQVPHQTPLGLARPTWIDDEKFDLRDHIKHHALPAPGGLTELQELVSWFMTEPLELDRAAWMVWVVDGLADNRWAVLTKVHHCMVDGIAGTDMMVKMFDPVEHAVAHASGVASTVAPTVRRPRPRIPKPRAAVSTALAPLHAAREIARLAVPRTGTSLAGSLGRDRSWAAAKIDLEDLRLIRGEFGCTINDVCISVLAKGFRDLMIHRGVDPSGHTIRSLVPVSVRASADHSAMGNRVTALIAELPVDVEDPVERLARTRSHLGRLKGSGEATAAQIGLNLLNLVPPAIYSAAVGLGSHLPQRIFATVTTNVPGSPVPLYLDGRRLRELYPYVPIAFQLRTGVAMTSYDGSMYFGVTADRDSTPDLDVLVSGIEEGVRELLKAVTRTA